RAAGRCPRFSSAGSRLADTTSWPLWTAPGGFRRAPDRRIAKAHRRLTLRLSRQRLDEACDLSLGHRAQRYTKRAAARLARLRHDVDALRAHGLRLLQRAVVEHRHEETPFVARVAQTAFARAPIERVDPRQEQAPQLGALRVACLRHVGVD